MTTAPGMEVLIAARLITGFASGFSSVLVPIYMGELSPPTLRGFFGTCTQFGKCLYGNDVTHHTPHTTHHTPHTTHRTPQTAHRTPPCYLYTTSPSHPTTPHPQLKPWWSVFWSPLSSASRSQQNRDGGSCSQ